MRYWPSCLTRADTQADGGENERGDAHERSYEPSGDGAEAD